MDEFELNKLYWFWPNSMQRIFAETQIPQNLIKEFQNSLKGRKIDKK